MLGKVAVFLRQISFAGCDVIGARGRSMVPDAIRHRANVRVARRPVARSGGGRNFCLSSTVKANPKRDKYPFSQLRRARTQARGRKILMDCDCSPRRYFSGGILVSRYRLNLNLNLVSR